MDQESVVFNSKIKWQLRLLPFVVIIVITLTLPHGAYLNHPMFITWAYDLIALMMILIESRIQITQTGIRHVLLLVGRIRITTIKEVAFEDIGNVEMVNVMRFKSLNITTKNRKRIVFNLGSFSNVDALLVQLFQFVKFDTRPITLDVPAGQDIGQRCLYVLGFAFILCVVALIVGNAFILYLHIESEHFLFWLFGTVPFAVLVIFRWIKAEQKAYPVVAACTSGLVLGIVLAYDIFSINHILTERVISPTASDFVFVRNQSECQYWRPVNPTEFNFQNYDHEISICDGWKEGYNNTLKVGSTYRLAVVKGYLNDISFPVNAFHEAVLLKPETSPTKT